MKNVKPTFYEFLEKTYNLSLDDYEALNNLQKKAVEIDYRDRYGSIKWF